MATELASAYLTLIPSLKGAQKQIEAQLSGINVSSSGKSIGASLTSGLKGAFGTVAKIGVGSVAAIGTAVAGLAVGGGISRSLKLDQAQFKFKALGMDVASAMQSCNEAVSGTAFGLDAAATVATQLGAAGVGSGDAMTGALKSIAGVAAMSGRSMEDVGSIFGKVAAKGKVTGDELLQLNEAGINGTAALAKHLGKSSAEIQKMVSSGEIDFATFSAAMQESFGEAASGANDTFQGAMSNVMAALSRVGAKFASPALGELRKVFVALIPAIDAISKALEPAVAAFTKFVEVISSKSVKTIEDFTESLKAGNGVAKSLGSAFSSLTGVSASSFSSIKNSVSSAVNSAMAKFSELRDEIMPVLNGISDGFSRLLTAFGANVPSFDQIVSAITSVRDVVVPIMDAVKESISSAFTFIATTFFGANTDVTGFATTFAAAFVVLGPKIAAFVAPFGGIVGLLSGFATAVGSVVGKVTGLGSAFMTAGGGIKGAATLLSALASPVGLVIAAVAALAAGFVYLMATNEGFRDTIMGLVSSIATSLAPIISVVSAAIQGLAVSVLPAIMNIIGLLLPFIQQVITLIFQVVAALAPVITAIVSILVPILSTLISIIVNVVSVILSAVMPVITAIVAAVSSAMPMIQQVITDVLGVVGSVFEGVWNAIQIAVTTVMGIIQSVINIGLAAINGDWEGVWSGIVSLFSGIWEGLKSAAQNGVDTVVSVVTGIKDTICNFFSGAGQWLADAGSAIVQGLIDGITGMIGSAGSAIGSVMDSIAAFLPHSPAKKGAFSGKGWTLYSGQAIIGDLAEGIIGSTGSASMAMKSVMGDISRSITTPISLPSNIQPFDAQNMKSPKMRLGNYADPQRNQLSKSDVYEAMSAAFESAYANEPTRVYIDGREATSILAPHMGSRLGQIERRRANGL